MGKQETPVRFIYVKDVDKTVTDIADFATATARHTELRKLYAEPAFRTRLRLRSRTGLYDIVVKRQTTAKAQEAASAQAAEPIAE